ncbi:MAG: acetyltransferase [Clostridia bacterium]
MKDLVIIGASGFGRELLQWVKDINTVKLTWNIKGFIDDNLRALDGYECDYSVIGNIADRQPNDNEEYAIAIAEPHIKEKIVTALRLKGAHFARIIHPRATICDFCSYGEGIVVYPSAGIGPNCVVGDFVSLLSSGLGHDAVVEDYATISSYCGISGHVHIGKRAFLASHAVIPPSKSVGDDAYVGAGSVVIRNVPNGKRVFGNPAKIIDI